MIENNNHWLYSNTENKHKWIRNICNEIDFGFSSFWNRNQIIWIFDKIIFMIDSIGIRYFSLACQNQNINKSITNLIVLILFQNLFGLYFVFILCDLFFFGLFRRFLFLNLFTTTFNNVGMDLNRNSNCSDDVFIFILDKWQSIMMKQDVKGCDKWIFIFFFQIQWHKRHWFYILDLKKKITMN